MNNQTFRKIASANGRLQAVYAQTVLERAGIPCRIVPARGRAYLNVLAPGERAAHARALLACAAL